MRALAMEQLLKDYDKLVDEIITDGSLSVHLAHNLKVKQHQGQILMRRENDAAVIRDLVNR